MSCRKAFGKTSATLPNDIDFFVPDTGPLNAESYKARLVTSNGTQQVKLPQSGVIVRYAYVSQRGCGTGNPHPPFLLPRESPYGFACLAGIAHPPAA